MTKDYVLKSWRIILSEDMFKGDPHYNITRNILNHLRGGCGHRGLFGPNTFSWVLLNRILPKKNIFGPLALLQAPPYFVVFSVV